MSNPSNSALSKALGVSIAETVGIEISWYGWKETAERKVEICAFSLEKSAISAVESITARSLRPGGAFRRATWGWVVRKGKAIPTLLVAFGQRDCAVAVLAYWTMAIEANGPDRQSLLSVTNYVHRENHVIEGGDLGVLGDFFVFPSVRVIEPTTQQGFQFEPMLISGRDLMMPRLALETETRPEFSDGTMGFANFDAGFFPAATSSKRTDMLGGWAK